MKDKTGRDLIDDQRPQVIVIVFMFFITYIHPLIGGSVALICVIAHLSDTYNVRKNERELVDSEDI